MKKPHAEADEIVRQSERYLSDLDRLLHGLPVIRRSEIILETRSILQKIAAESSSASDFQARARIELGAPVVFANRHRRAAGIPLLSEKPPFRWLRAMVIGFAALILIVGISVFLLARSFLPLFEQDTQTGRTRIFGGWVEIDPSGGGVRVGKGRFQIQPDQMRINLSTSDGRKTQGVVDLQGVSLLDINGSNGALVIRAVGNKAGTKGLAYECTAEQVDHLSRDPVSRKDKGHVVFTMPSDQKNARCELTLAATPEIHVDLRNGNIRLEDLRHTVTAKVGNGNIIFAPRDFDRYEISARVSNGSIMLPDQKPKARDLKADLEAGNGTITGP